MTTKDFFHMLLASVMLAATAGLTVACTSNDDNPASGGPSEAAIKEKIVGKWKATTQDDVWLTTNGRTVLTFNADGTRTVSKSYFNADTNAFIWRNQQTGTYAVEDSRLKSYLDEADLYDVVIYDIALISSRRMMMTMENFRPGRKFTYARVDADYAEAIVGLWEGVEMTGDETYGGADARIAYLPDGTYRYYQKDANGEWAVRENQEVSEYNVDGDWLATRWQETGGEMNYEWWDIDDISDGQMKWSALREREDGTRFQTTFTWKKVSDIAFVIDEEHFPDANFRAELMKQEYGKDGVVTEQERMNVDYIYVPECDIQTLKGIELFTELRGFACYGNQLTSLDVSKNTKLTELQCQYNQLKELDLTQNPWLRTVVCSNNQLTSLQVANLEWLNVLNCQDNLLETIDLTGCKNLVQFMCYNNKIRGAGMDALVASLYSYTGDPELSRYMQGALYAVDTKISTEQNAMTKAQVAAAKAKGWTVFDYQQGKREDGHSPYYEGIDE